MESVEEFYLGHFQLPRGDMEEAVWGPGGRSKQETSIWESRSYTWHFKPSGRLRIARERAAREEGSELSPELPQHFKSWKRKSQQPAEETAHRQA